MKNLFLTVLGLVMASAICADVTLLFQFGERLTRVETEVHMLVSQQTHIAKNP